MKDPNSQARIEAVVQSFSGCAVEYDAVLREIG
jgi:hypothetical protein